MQLAVKHTLEVFKTEDGQPGADAPLVLPIRETETAVMGETVTGFLVRAGWRFDLPTICLINGECYGRAEWPTQALAVNDNVEFVSRPLGSGSGGSTVKSIASVVALVALTAVAGPLGTAIGGSLATAGSFAATAISSLATAAIVGASAVPVATWLATSVPWWRRALETARNSLRSILAVAGRFWSLSR